MKPLSEIESNDAKQNVLDGLYREKNLTIFDQNVQSKSLKDFCYLEILRVLAGLHVLAEENGIHDSKWSHEDEICEKK